MHISPGDLDVIERALTLQGEWDKALEIVKAVRDNVASPDMVNLAHEEFGSDDIEIDSDAGTSPHDEGCWVQAWVHLRKPVRECATCSGSGSVGRLGNAAPEGTEDYFSTFTCPECAGAGEIAMEFGEGEN